MVLGRGLTKFFDCIGEILAVLTITLIAFLYLNANFNFITDLSLIRTLTVIREYMILGTVIIVGLEFAVKRNILFFIIFAALAAVAVIFSFFPESIPAFLENAASIKNTITF